jgi:putative ABC transport system ATP-binding protein
MKCLELRDVSYRYEGSSDSVLNNVSAEFESGKVYSIIGQSGAGKSTLLSLISGLDTCREGDIYYGGENLRSIDRDEYRAKRVGVIFQGYNLLLNSTAVYNVTLSMSISANGSKERAASGQAAVEQAGNGRAAKGQAVDVRAAVERATVARAGNGRAAESRAARKQAAYAVLLKVGIDHETADRKILKLSGGEQQRVGIARALSHDPDVIIADEPTGNLDADTEKAVLDIFSRLAHDEGKCVIIVTHSENVSAIADEVIGIRAGRLVSGAEYQARA